MTQNALDNLTAADPAEIVTGCPLCLSTFGRYADRPVRDLAEVLDARAESGGDRCIAASSDDRI